jgi:RND family efflux transporter MFP subunit
MSEQRRAVLADLKIDRQGRPPAGVGRWLVAGVVALAVLVTVGLWWRGRAAAAEVVTAEVRAGEPAASGAAGVLDASGYVVARRRSTISSKVTGRIEEVTIEEGVRVEEGQPLARLDPSQAEAQLALAEAQLAAARRALEEIRVRVAEARLELGRQESLVASGISTPAILDAARAEVDSLVARLAVAGEEAEVADRLVAVRRQDLADTVIRAPFAGIVVSKDAQPGEMISPVSAGGGFTRTGICTLVDMASLEIEVDVNEAYIQRIHPGQAVTAVLDAYPDQPMAAHLITTVPTADRQKATVKVRIGFEEIDPRVLPEMGVKVTFLEEAGEAADGAPVRPRLLVPEAAVRSADGSEFVFVVADGRAARRAVRVAARRGDELELASGVTAGERVVIDGPQDLADGDRVVPVAAATGT